MEKVRIGLWGIGRAGWTMHKKEVARFSDMLEIVGCCDLIPERMEKFCEEVPGCKAYPNIDDMLKAEDIDVISVATRSPDHVEHAIKALESGKFVFAEKPIGINYAEVLKLISFFLIYTYFPNFASRFLVQNLLPSTPRAFP